MKKRYLIVALLLGSVGSFLNAGDRLEVHFDTGTGQGDGQQGFPDGKLPYDPEGDHLDGDHLDGLVDGFPEVRPADGAISPKGSRNGSGINLDNPILTNAGEGGTVVQGNSGGIPTDIATIYEDLGTGNNGQNSPIEKQLLDQIEQLQHENTRLQERIEETEKYFGNLEQEFQEVSNRNEELERSLRIYRAKNSKDLAQELSAVQERLVKLQEQHESVLEEKEAIIETQKSLQEDKQAMEQALIEMQSEHDAKSEANQAKISKLEASLQQLTSESIALAYHESEIDQMRKAYEKEFETLVETHTGQLAEKKDENRSLQEQIGRLEKEIKKLKLKNETNLGDELSDAQQTEDLKNLEKLKETLVKEQSERAKLEKEMAELRKQLLPSEPVESPLQKAQEEIAKLKEEINQLTAEKPSDVGAPKTEKAEVQELKTELKAEEKEVSSLEQQKPQNNSSPEKPAEEPSKDVLIKVEMEGKSLEDVKKLFDPNREPKSVFADAFNDASGSKLKLVIVFEKAADGTVSVILKPETGQSKEDFEENVKKYALNLSRMTAEILIKNPERLRTFKLFETAQSVIDLLGAFKSSGSLTDDTVLVGLEKVFKEKCADLIMEVKTAFEELTSQPEKTGKPTKGGDQDVTNEASYEKFRSKVRELLGVTDENGPLDSSENDPLKTFNSAVNELNTALSNLTSSNTAEFKRILDTLWGGTFEQSYVPKITRKGLLGRLKDSASVFAGKVAGKINDHIVKAVKEGVSKGVDRLIEGVRNKTGIDLSKLKQSSTDEPAEPSEGPAGAESDTDEPAEQSDGDDSVESANEQPDEQSA